MFLYFYLIIINLFIFVLTQKQQIIKPFNFQKEIKKEEKINEQNQQPLDNAPHMLEGLKNKNKSVENNNTLGLDRELLSLIPLEGGGGFLNKTATTEDILTTTTDSWIGVQPEEPVILPPPDLPIILPKPSVNCTDEHKNCQYWAKNGFCKNKFYKPEIRLKFCIQSCELC
uniref:ShKT domain-containing protein n=1 Tax=Meloidogyne floridensis TaxID=298350 RepID=A0A915NX75_9BILA